VGIIIGYTTKVSFGSACAISANWGTSLNPQKLYCIGEWTPYKTIYKAQQTLSLTVYSPGPSFDCSPSESCEAGRTISASVVPIGCGGGTESITGTWFVTGYNYTKEPGMPGQESWSLMKYLPKTSDNLGPPKYNLLGICEGNASGDTYGLEFKDSISAGSSGSVSAAAIGKSEEQITGEVQSVGAGSSVVEEQGSGSCSMPWTPLWYD
jgi:hypothetical protein